MPQPIRENPFQAEGEWLKVGIHVHTSQSDGAVSPARALEVYKQHGYDVLVFGDHWHVTTPEDPHQELLVIPGAEYHANFPAGPAGLHFMAVGVHAGHHEALRDLLGQPYAMAEALKGICDYLVLAHPYWSALTTELIAPLSGFGGLEVYNHGCEVEDGLGHSTYVWDQLLARGHRWDGLAVDDAHWRRDDDHCGGWVMVKAKARTPAEVIAALQAGRFYSSMGPEIHELEFLGPRRPRVRTSPASTILFRCNGALGQGRHADPDGRLLTQAEHELPERAIFVRIEVTDPAGRKAWTNPFYLAP
jgi:hypothetical protein